MPLIDIGANLTHDSFDADRHAVLQRARDAGVTQFNIYLMNGDEEEQLDLYRPVIEHESA